MASPPQISKSLLLNRIPPRFKTVADVEKWARDLLRSLELQLGLGSSSFGGNPTFGSLSQGNNFTQPDSYPYTPAFTDGIVLVDTSVARSITLPGVSVGFTTVIMDNTGTAGANNITITPAGAEKINGAGSYTIGTNFGAVRVLGTGISGSEWVAF